MAVSRRAKVDRYMKSAEALLKVNPAAAANAYRLALTLEPENQEIIAKMRELTKHLK